MSVTKLFFSRLIAVVPVLFVVSIVAFLLARATPIDPVVQILGESSTTESQEQLRSELGLNRGALSQYGSWLWGTLHGDLGSSFFTHRDVTSTVVDRLGVTLSLAIVGMVLALLVGITLGVLGALRPGSVPDRLLSLGVITGLAVPSFWLSMLLALVFGVLLRLLPAVGYTPIGESFTGWLATVTLPAIALSVHAGAVIARQTRAAMITTLESNYVLALRSRGITERRIVTRYAIKNALVPVLAAISIQMSIMIGASFTIEVVFGIQGLGTYLIDSVFHADYPAMQGAVLATALVVLFINFVVDLAYGVVNPKVRPS